MLNRLIVALVLRGRPSCLRRRAQILLRITGHPGPNTTRNAIRIPLPDHDLAIYLLQMYDVAVHVAHRPLHLEEVLHDDLEVLF